LLQFIIKPFRALLKDKKLLMPIVAAVVYLIVPSESFEFGSLKNIKLPNIRLPELRLPKKRRGSLNKTKLKVSTLNNYPSNNNNNKNKANSESIKKRRPSIDINSVESIQGKSYSTWLDKMR